MEIKRLDNTALRNFGIVTGLIVGILFGFLVPWLLGSALPIWPWLLAGILWLFALVVPGRLGPVYKIWMKFGYIAGTVNSRIILTLLFFLVVLPMAIALKLLGKDPMKRKFDNDIKSYRVQSNKHISSLENPF